MRLGRGITAARRQASRLAGLVRLPVCCRVKTAIRRQASWLAKKASVILISRWPFALQNIQAALKHSTSQGVRMPTADCGARKSAYSSAPQNFQATPKHLNSQGVRLPHANRGEKKISLFIRAAKFPSHTETSQPARGEYAHRRLRGSRAAIGSGGKKARPF